jgi:long-subunit fatty acid transport protein
MKKQLLILSLVAMLTLFATLAPAAQFSVVGPRALGMGGASVASVNDSTAVYWNPAALADFRKVDIRIPASMGARDHVDLQDKWDRIHEIHGLVTAGTGTARTDAINETLSLLNDLDKPHAGVDLDASLGLLISIPLGKSAMAVSGLGQMYAGISSTVDTFNLSSTPSGTTPFVGYNHSAVTGIGVTAVEPTLSFATSFGNKLFVGANAKMIYADTYVHSDLLTANNFDTFSDNLDKSKTSSRKASADIGILFKALDNLSLGLVGRDLTSPSFPVEGVFAQKQVNGDVTLAAYSREIKLDPQYRAGVAWTPFETFTVAMDYDLTKNKTLTTGFEDQTLALGLEKTFFSEYLNVRLGAYQNLADSGAKAVYTGGIGLRLFALRLDVAGAYNSDKDEAQVSVDLALRF